MRICTNSYDTEKAFRDFLSLHNHPIDGEINYDSNMFHSLKCPNGCTTDARYKFYPNGYAYLKCWKCQIEAKFWANQWRSDQQRKIASTEWHKKDYQIETKQKYAAAAKQAEEVFSISSPEKASTHAYLRLKQVNNYGLRILTKENRITQEVKCYPGTLLVPCYNVVGELVNLERIYFSKKERKFQKRPLSGAQRTGTFFIIGENKSKYDVVVIAEGYATAATIYEATRYPTVASFYCANLSHVAQAFSKKYPQIKIIIASDLDSNKSGEIHAKNAVKLVSGACVLPDFSMIPNHLRNDIKRSDFNDLFILLMAKGLDRTAALSKVQQQIQLA